jgi:hypothetical protein
LFIQVASFVAMARRCRVHGFLAICAAAVANVAATNAIANSATAGFTTMWQMMQN